MPSAFHNQNPSLLLSFVLCSVPSPTWYIFLFIFLFIFLATPTHPVHPSKQCVSPGPCSQFFATASVLVLHNTIHTYYRLPLVYGSHPRPLVGFLLLPLSSRIHKGGKRSSWGRRSTYMERGCLNCSAWPNCVRSQMAKVIRNLHVGCVFCTWAWLPYPQPTPRYPPNPPASVPTALDSMRTIPIKLMKRRHKSSESHEDGDTKIWP